MLEYAEKMEVSPCGVAIENTLVSYTLLELNFLLEHRFFLFVLVFVSGGLNDVAFFEAE